MVHLHPPNVCRVVWQARFMIMTLDIGRNVTRVPSSSDQIIGHSNFDMTLRPLEPVRTREGFGTQARLVNSLNLETFFPQFLSPRFARCLPTVT